MYFARVALLPFTLEEFLDALWRQVVAAFQIGDIGETIRHAILQKKISFELGDWQVLLTDAVVISFFAVLIACMLLIWMASRRDIVPTGRQLFVETIVALFVMLCEQQGMSRKQAEKVAPFTGSIGFFLLACNLMALFRIPPPAKNPAFPFALAILTMVYVIMTSIRFVGLRGFWDALTDPMPVILPFKIIDYLIKPLSLALRLFGNIFGAFILMEFLFIVMPLVVPGLFGLWFDIADALLQATIFVYLSTAYIGEILESAERKKLARQQKDLASQTI